MDRTMSSRHMGFAELFHAVNAGEITKNTFDRRTSEIAIRELGPDALAFSTKPYVINLN